MRDKAHPAFRFLPSTSLILLSFAVGIISGLWTGIISWLFAAETSLTIVENAAAYAIAVTVSFSIGVLLTDGFALIVLGVIKLWLLRIGRMIREMCRNTGVEDELDSVDERDERKFGWWAFALKIFIASFGCLTVWSLVALTIAYTALSEDFISIEPTVYAIYFFGMLCFLSLIPILIPLVDLEYRSYMISKRVHDIRRLREAAAERRNLQQRTGMFELWSGPLRILSPS